jgi:hypothetical protein
MNTNYFYKYYTINQNFLNSIVNNELYFSDPRNFNDPFDSLPRIRLSDNFEQLNRFYYFISNKIKEKENEINQFSDFDQKSAQIKTLLNTFLDLLKRFDESYNVDSESKELRLIEILIFYSDISIFKKAYSVNKVYAQIKMYLDFIFLCIELEKYGVVCGSRSSTCPVMWGHYGNNHKGLCLKGNFQEGSEKGICMSGQAKIQNVIYSDYPLEIFNYNEEELNNLVFKIFQFKSQKWSYENEIRLVKNEQGLIKIRKNCISQIIFGCKSTPKDRYTICKLFASLQYKINDISIAKIQPDNYELNIEPMLLEDIAGSGAYIKY